MNEPMKKGTYFTFWCVASLGCLVAYTLSALYQLCDLHVRPSFARNRNPVSLNELEAFWFVLLGSPRVGSGSGTARIEASDDETKKCVSFFTSFFLQALFSGDFFHPGGENGFWQVKAYSFPHNAWSQREIQSPPFSFIVHICFYKGTQAQLGLVFFSGPSTVFGVMAQRGASLGLIPSLEWQRGSIVS